MNVKFSSSRSKLAGKLLLAKCHAFATLRLVIEVLCNTSDALYSSNLQQATWTEIADTNEMYSQTP